MPKIRRQPSIRRHRRRSLANNHQQTLVEKFQAEFLNLDADGDGKISTDELGNVLRSLQVTLKISHADIQRVIKEIDKDGNGIIEVSEYFRYMRNKNEQDIMCKVLFHQSKMYKEFQRFDKDGSGFITEDELADVIKSTTGMEVSPYQLRQLICDSDTDNDGKINFLEFAMFMAK